MAADSQEMNTQDSHPPVSVKLYKNPISLIGMALAAVAFANILFLFFLDAFSHVSSPYVGILAYMVAPAIMIVGLVMIPVGMIIERRRRLHEVGHPPHFAKFDLNNPAQRSAAAFALSFVVIFALMSAVGSYKAYEFTDSVQFCVMRSLAETGNGWMTFKDATNLKCNQTGRPGNVVHLSNLCTEITE